MNFLSDFYNQDLPRIIHSFSEDFCIDARLVAAVILQESGGNPWVSRYEPHFYNEYIKDETKETLLGYVPKTISLETEKRDRATSWGLMQCLGETMRECGYEFESLTKLIIPSVGIYYGCLYLSRCLSNRSLENGLLKYNGGGNKEYPKSVLNKINNKEYKKIIGDL